MSALPGRSSSAWPWTQLSGETRLTSETPSERFDWLVAMEAGKVPSTETPSEMRTRGNAESLEEAFIALLPPERRAGRRSLVIPPRRPGSKGLTTPLKQIQKSVE
jgi:hypothetical protein